MRARRRPQPGLLQMTALREQVRRAIVRLAQGWLDHPQNLPILQQRNEEQSLADHLFVRALVTIYKWLLCARRGEHVAVSALGRTARADTDLQLSAEAERQVIDHLLWADVEGAKRQHKVAYDALTIEDLGHVYEGLLPLSPGIAKGPMIRVRRRDLSVVVPLAEHSDPSERDVVADGAFFLSATYGRKVASAYFTPRSLVDLLISETLGPLVETVSPPHKPSPEGVLSITVLDPAMGTGHFLLAACRFLAEALVLTWKQAGQLDEIHRVHSSPEAHAKRMVAARCIYGVDKDPTAVTLAKLSFQAELHDRNGELTSMDGRLVAGDSLLGPMFDRLSALPPERGAREDGLRSALVKKLEQALANDHDLGPFRLLASVWSGAVMSGRDLQRDYQALARAVAHGEDETSVLEGRPALKQAAFFGRGVVCYDLLFPEVFWPDRSAQNRARGGFSAVVGNPPWDAVRRNDDELFSAFDVDLRRLPGRLDKKRRMSELQKDPKIAAFAFEQRQMLKGKDRIVNELYTTHRARVRGVLAGRGKYDDYLLFAERAAALLAKDVGRAGLILPSAFYAAEGTVGLRRLYFEEMQIEQCYSFENRKRLFEIDGRCKFALVVAQSSPRSRPRSAARCAFYAHDPQEVQSGRGVLNVSPAFIAKTGGDYLTLLELRSVADEQVVEAMIAGGLTFGEARGKLGVVLGQEANMTYSARRFSPMEGALPGGGDPREPGCAQALRAKGYLPLHEGKTFHQYTDRWEARPRFAVEISAVKGKRSWARAAGHYRLAFRDIASATNERTGIFALLPPGVLCGNKAPCEREPTTRPNAASLILLALACSFPFDYALRLRVQSTVNLFLLDACPVPPAALTPPRSLFLAHSALRLSANHDGYRPLWEEQLGPRAWREKRNVYDWPALASEEDRWALRAAIDAVVAEAYGLSRAAYGHVLSTFAHTTYPNAPTRCLAAFDELAAIGLVELLKRHDPYHGVPLVGTPPEAPICL